MIGSAKDMANSMFVVARNAIVKAGYQPEIDYVQNRYFKDIDESEFFFQYVYVVMCWRVKEQIASKQTDNYFKNLDPSVITCYFKDKKRAAVEIAKENFVRWFGELKAANDPFKYLQTLPCIGKVMKFHLARNLGFDCIKPDRHLIMLSLECGFKTPLEMCESIQCSYPEYRIGTIDVILWRWCNLGRSS
jgi:hypothetical protein